MQIEILSDTKFELQVAILKLKFTRAKSRRTADRDPHTSTTVYLSGTRSLEAALLRPPPPAGTLPLPASPDTPFGRALHRALVPNPFLRLALTRTFGPVAMRGRLRPASRLVLRTQDDACTNLEKSRFWPRGERRAPPSSGREERGAAARTSRCGMGVVYWRGYATLPSVPSPAWSPPPERVLRTQNGLQMDLEISRSRPRGERDGLFVWYDDGVDLDEGMPSTCVWRGMSAAQPRGRLCKCDASFLTREAWLCHAVFHPGPRATYPSRSHSRRCCDAKIVPTPPSIF
ncbi:hypothetical protein OF83DRAFT_1175722 [Amylostereum chailletii]|nr:hypothetical protein OF83DRAFT_1175722 [Amylostereum chailletii]